ncbi:MAG: response regulator [Candidatus Omnitrophica bacterium]|nr:response regulator [Candidatus Omnitrophota bacterium]
MAILDILNRDEANFFTETLKNQLVVLNRDFDLLFNSKVKVAQPTFNYLTYEKIVEALPPQCIHIISQWEGECAGNVITTFKESDGKILRGLLMMMQTAAIQDSLKADFTDEIRDTVKELAGQFNSTHESAMREVLSIDLHITLKDVNFQIAAPAAEGLRAIFDEQGYLSHAMIMKIADFPDSSITQYYPVTMMKKVFKLEKVGINSQGAAGKKNAKTILIIDDNMQVRKQIKGFLKEYDLNIVEADDGVKALQLLTRIKVDLVFLSLEVPQMDGLELCKRMQGNPRLESVPVIACSSQSSRENVLSAIHHGARDFVVKPITSKNQIESKIKQYLK